MQSLKLYLSLVITIFLLFFISLIGNCLNEEFKLEKVTEHLYVISSDLGGNTAFLITEEGVVVVDAKYFPYQGEQIVSKIREVTDKPIRYLIYTHYHGDHTQGAQAFPPSTLIIAHINTYKNMKTDGLPRIEKDKSIYFPEQLKALEEKVEKLKAEQSPELQKATEELELKRFQIKDYERLKLIYPHITFVEKASIHLGGQKIELLYMGSAHTDGDILVYFPSEKAIHMGDILSWPGEEEEKIKSLDIIRYLERMKTEQIKHIIKSMENEIKILEKAAETDFEKAIPGHGKITDKNGVRTQIEYAKKLLIEVKKLIK